MIFYLFHNVCELNIDAYLDEKYGIFNYLIKQRKISRIKHLGFSAHGGYSVMKRKVLSDEEKRVILDIADRMVSATAIPCTACRYCSSHCPQGLDIPALLALYNEHCSTEGGFIAPMTIRPMKKEKDPMPVSVAEAVRQSARSRLKYQSQWKTLQRNLWLN